MTASGNEPRASNAPSSEDRLAVFGYITAVLIPVVGVVVGAVLARRGDRRGTYVMVLAVAVFAVFLWLIAGS